MVVFPEQNIIIYLYYNLCYASHLMINGKASDKRKMRAGKASMGQTTLLRELAWILALKVLLIGWVWWRFFRHQPVVDPAALF